MATIIWKETPPVWTAFVEDTPVCTLRSKDIGGWTASWAGERLWPPPVHLPRAAPQATRYFMSLDEARAAVEAELGRA
jgi:hypothetical protein